MSANTKPVRRKNPSGRRSARYGRTGSVWAHNDGEGFNIRLNGLVPLNGEIVVRSMKDKPKTDDGDESAFVDADGVVS